MITYETRTITEEFPVAMHCDVCGSQIFDSQYYYYATTRHNDWGNDSVDSLKEYHVCSDGCLREIFDDYVDIMSSKTKELTVSEEQARINDSGCSVFL